MRRKGKGGDGKKWREGPLMHFWLRHCSLYIGLATGKSAVTIVNAGSLRRYLPCSVRQMLLRLTLSGPGVQRLLWIGLQPVAVLGPSREEAQALPVSWSPVMSHFFVFPNCRKVGNFWKKPRRRQYRFTNYSDDVMQWCKSGSRHGTRQIYFSFRGGFRLFTPWPRALPLDPAGGSGLRLPLYASATALAVGLCPLPQIV